MGVAQHLGCIDCTGASRSRWLRDANVWDSPNTHT